MAVNRSYHNTCPTGSLPIQIILPFIVLHVSNLARRPSSTGAGIRSIGTQLLLWKYGGNERHRPSYFSGGTRYYICKRWKESKFATMRLGGFAEFFPQQCCTSSTQCPLATSRMFETEFAKKPVFIYLFYPETTHSSIPWGYVPRSKKPVVQYSQLIL